ncbi:hypothetical protein AMK68_01060 [candidate division KD3-62 bacterium DG_56]|uniref:Uncharacterized protein n=1 Tax=candidate division KD3-62 bacterium DG_56 TaxID=1704032 RepID=A0A0S7XQB2_9BACT|nr:MAG: hypothetical protein AMK68_01060 [candidate division KD3-62 bacterium DG_56]
MRVGLARLTAGLLGLAALSALRPADLEAAGNRVAIVSPKAGSTVSGTVTIRVTVTGEPTPDYLILAVDQDRPYSTNCQPYNIEFDTTQYGDGVHYIWAEAYTRAALIGVSERVKLVVSNGSQPPAMPDWLTSAPSDRSAPVAVSPELVFPGPAMPMVAEPSPMLGDAEAMPPSLSVVVMGKQLRSDVSSAPCSSVLGRSFIGKRTSA